MTLVCGTILMRTLPRLTSISSCRAAGTRVEAGVRRAIAAPWSRMARVKSPAGFALAAVLARHQDHVRRHRGRHRLPPEPRLGDAAEVASLGRQVQLGHR